MNQEFYEEYVKWYKDNFYGLHPESIHKDGRSALDLMVELRDEYKNSTKEINDVDVGNLRLLKTLTYQEYIDSFNIKNITMQIKNLLKDIKVKYSIDLLSEYRDLKNGMPDFHHIPAITTQGESDIFEFIEHLISNSKIDGVTIGEINLEII